MTCPYIDMHCDTLLRSLMHKEQSIYDGEGMQSLKQMQEAGQMAQFFAVFFPPRNRPNPNPDFVMPPDDEFFEILSTNLEKEVAAHNDIFALAKSGSDIEENYKNGKLSAVLSIEDGRFVNGDMDKLIGLKKKGVCAISLTWNFANCFGFPNSKDAEIMGKGLTDFGKEAIGVMNETGIIVDVSHLSDGGFWDVVELTKKPFVATHSNCRAISPHTRNLTDDMIKALAKKGGVAGLNFGAEFISSDITSTVSRVEDLANNVLHMLKTGGEDIIALGTDFDGIRGTFEIEHPTQMSLLTDALEKKGVTPRQIDKFLHENVLRVMKDCIG